MKPLRTASILLLLVLLFVLGFGLGVRYEDLKILRERERITELFSQASGSGAILTGDPEKQVDLSILWSVWRLLQKHYIHPEILAADTMVYGAVSGLVDSLGDPYTLFMTPKDTKGFTDSLSGTLEGIGAQLHMDGARITVTAPIKGSPAEKVGILPRDIITAVNGTSVVGMKLEEAVAMIRGPKGTDVTLTIERGPKPDILTMRVVRDSVHIPSVESVLRKTPQGSLGIITINQFGDDTVPETAKALRDFPKDIKGVVLDLRFNGGGYLEGAIDIVSMFLAKGKVVTVVRRDAQSVDHVVTGSPILPDIPLVVLVNGGSASASEITAGALKDAQRAMLVGMQTFGKGTVQEVLELPGGSSLRVTVATWLTPSGHDLGKQGIAPDIVIDRTIEEVKAGKDPQMDKAVQILLERFRS